MAGWSMVAGDEDYDGDGDDLCKTPRSFDLNKSPEAVSHSDSIDELVSSFRRLLESFVVEYCPPPPLPPATVDLFSLFVGVSHRGGLKAVSENNNAATAWDEVGRECGLGFGDSAKLIYVKYLAALARWLNRDTSVELPGISDDLIGRLRDFVSRVKRKYELSNDGTEEVGAEFKWFISKTKRRYDESVKTSEKVVMLVSGSNNKDCSSPGKRKRECSLETLRWLREAAKDPCDMSVGSLPDRSKWDSYASEEPWRQLLLFRASRTNTDPSCQKIWQKIQKMHPSLYQDSAGPSYNLRERLSLDESRFNERKAGKGKISSEDGSGSEGSDEEYDESWALVGSEFQAEVPEWTGITTESDSKWLGTLMWPLNKEQNNNNLLIERDPIGKGRQDPCGCQNPGSVECVRFHIKIKQEKLKLELGSAFYMWCFDTMGEGNLQYWTDLELKKVVSLMPSPPTLIPSFFGELKIALPSKSRGKIVSYFYNVTLLQFRANQSRMTPDEIDSDTDTQYRLATASEDPTLEANTSQKPVLLTPKKKRRR
ncbi:AT-rich interactive domain-containing protein 1 [Raphanus sativus]|nr:AT-rich interactive domain-containing protein 1 isoform X2 [Raphanus sativus]XP_056844844.1 AT-rich interactive domain-containing protein 1 isoform X2 [Raphanus sativus]KAJ4892410.1 AT-rich interactive domain-containing protein 1 [Raphanus sativus]